MTSVLGAFEVRVEKQLKKLQGRLEEFFKDYDVHRCKKITPAQFVRACDLMGIKVNDRELEAVQQAYGTDNGDIYFEPFADGVNRVFTTKHLELDPDCDRDGALEPPIKGRLHVYGGKLDADEQLMCSAVLQKCERLAKTRGLIFKAFFLDHDRNNNGFVTPSQFHRAMQVCFRGAVTHAEVALLAKRYSDGADVNYKAMHVDITPDAVAPGRTSGTTFRESRRVPALDAGYETLNTSRIMRTIIRETSSRRVRVKEFFSEFDPMRTGHCTAAQFKRALVLCNFNMLTAADMTALCRKYFNAEREKVNYTAFCAEVDAAFTQPELEKNPTQSLDCLSRTIARGPRHERAQLSPRTAERAEAALKEIKTFVLQRRLGLTLVLLFQDFDRAHEEFITRAQFQRVLKSINCLPTSPASVEALLDRFAGDGPRARTHIDYRAFLEEIEPNRTLKRAGAATLASTNGGAGGGERKTPPPVDVGEVLKKVKLATRKGQVRLEEFMRDYDKLRHGGITRHQLDTALSSAGVRLSPAETLALAEAFVFDAMVDAQGNPFVAWKELVDDVDAIFTVKHLETDPDANVPRITRTALNQSIKLPDVAAGAVTGGRRLTDAQEGELRSLLDRLNRRVKTRRLELPAFLHEFDRLHHGVLSKPQFLRCMDRVGLPLQPRDTDLLIRAFHEPTSDRVDINYKWFVEALDNVDEVLAKLPGDGEAPAVAGAVVGEYKAPGVDRSTKVIPRDNVEFEDLLERIQSEFSTRRIRMREFMKDYDRLSSGHMPACKLRTALAAAGVPLRPEELDLLEQHYKREDGEVNWRELAWKVDGGNEYLEQDPLKTLEPVRRRDMMATRPLGSAGIDELLDKLQRFIAYRNMLVKPFFQDYDPRRNRCCTRHQFASVLNLLKLPVSEAEVRSLQDAFAATGVGQRDRVNYLEFCRRVDPTER